MKRLGLVLGVMSFFCGVTIFLVASNDEATALLLDGVVHENLENVKVAIATGPNVNVTELLKHKAILPNTNQKLVGSQRGTSGFWGIIKNGEEKMIFSQFDSYPEGLGKEVVCLIQNNLECLGKIFDRIIFINNIDNLDESEVEFILVGPETLINDDIKEKYFSESAKKYFEHGGLEYGYMIDLDKSVLKLYMDEVMISEINLDKIKYKDLARAFRNFEK